ncbi:MAG: hypothetical protein J5J06_18565, partial [Phycisphaerae bacterium]|nr:hypothetical protein [Phycisphaerae bacterium]
LTVNQSTSWGDRDADGDVDATDKGTVGVTCTGTPSAECRILDLDFDGDYDSTDATAFDDLVQGAAKKAGIAHSGVEQVMGHQGLLSDPEAGSCQNRGRHYSTRTRSFLQRDPLTWIHSSGSGFQDGMGLYSYLRNDPIRNLDPQGTVALYTYTCTLTGSVWQGAFCLNCVYVCSPTACTNLPGFTGCLCWWPSPCNAPTSDVASINVTTKLPFFATCPTYSYSVPIP